MIPKNPTISLLIPMRNESRYIKNCLLSIFVQDYPSNLIEVLVMDGESEDDSFQIVESLFQNRQNCHLLSNPKITQAAAWNIGIKESRGDIVGIVSAHSILAADYVSEAVETLIRTKADLVGGPTRSTGDGAVGKAIALAMETPFGVGGGRFHYTKREEEVDTVFMGLCWRRSYEEIGGFDEEMVRNQDDELSYRLLKHGGQIICNPSIKSRYFSRGTLPSLWKQYFQYGLWKVRVLQKHPKQMRPRQFIPGVFVTSLLVLAATSFFIPLARALLIVTVVTYLTADLLASFWTSWKKGWTYLSILPLVYPAMHLSYGLGFLIGFLKFRNRWGDNRGKEPVFKNLGAASE